MTFVAHCTYELKKHLTLSTYYFINFPWQLVYSYALRLNRRLRKCLFSRKRIAVPDPPVFWITANKDERWSSTCHNDRIKRIKNTDIIAQNETNSTGNLKQTRTPPALSSWSSLAESPLPRLPSSALSHRELRIAFFPQLSDYVSGKQNLLFPVNS